MRQSYAHNVEKCFDEVKNQFGGLIKTRKDTTYRKMLSDEIKNRLSILERENEDKWNSLSMVTFNPRYIADVILRVEFILVSLIRISTKIKDEESIESLTLNDYKGMLTAPTLPHSQLFDEDSNKVEVKLRLYFNKGWYHTAVIVRDINDYFVAREALGGDLFLFDKLAGTKIDKDIMKEILFGKEGFIRVNNISNNDIRIRKEVLARMLSRDIEHNEVEISPKKNSYGMKKITEYCVCSKKGDKSDKKKSNMVFKFAAKDKDGYAYPVRDVYNTIIRDKYAKFLSTLENKQSMVSAAKRKNESIKIDMDDVLEFVREEMDKVEPNKGWLTRAESINFYNAVAQERRKGIQINSVNHWIGLPNVGKTTIMNILAAYLAKKAGMKVALIMRENNDVSSSADTLIKCGVKAVPFIGLSGQEDHFRKRFNSLDTVDDVATDNVLPFYSNTCKLKSLLDLSATDNVKKEDFCFSIGISTKEIRKKDDVNSGNVEYDGYWTCPYIFECERYSSRHQFENNSVYLTNIQSCVQTITKKALFKEQVTSFELLLKECDVILIDEADDAIETADSFFLDEEFVVEGREMGVLESLIEEVDRESRGKKANHREVTKWLRLANHCKHTASEILHSITDGVIPKAITRHPFTSRGVINYWTCKVLKPTETELKEENEETVLESLEFESAAIHEKRRNMFDLYDTYVNNLIISLGKGTISFYKDELINSFMEASYILVYNGAEEGFLEKADECCELFLERFEIELKCENKVDKKRIDSIKDIFRFAITVTTFEALYSYTQRNIDACRRFIKNDDLINKTGFANAFYKHYDGLIPLAAGGAKYGLSYEEENEKKCLKLKKYLNVGRYLLYNIPTIFKNIDSTETARVVLLSATSYMPYSPNYHLDVEPDYILESNDISNLTLSYKKLFLRDSEGNIIKFSGCSPDKTKKILDDMAKDLCYVDFTNSEYKSKLDKAFNTTLNGRNRMAFTVGSFVEAHSFAESLLKYLSEYRHGDKYKLCVIDSEENREYGIENVFLKSNLDKFNETDYNLAIIVTASLERGVNILTRDEHDKYIAAFSTLMYIKRPYVIPNNMSDLVAIINSSSMEMYNMPYDEACRLLGGTYSVGKFVGEISKKAKMIESDFYNRTYYRFIDDDMVRNQIIANLLVTTHQLEGRFYRGNVPATIIFADGAFFPEEANENRQKESYKTSIVEGFIKYFDDLSNCKTEEDKKRYAIIEKLYGFRIKALKDITYIY